MSILVLILQIFLGIMFVLLGISSLIGPKPVRENFKHLGVPNFFRILTGIVQLIGGIGSFIGIFVSLLSALSSIWIILIMIVALGLHVRIKEPFKKNIPAIAVSILALLVLILH